MTQPEVVLEKERDFSEVFNASFSFLTQEIKGLIKVLALYGGIPIIGVVIFSAFYTQNVMSSVFGAMQGMNQGVMPNVFLIILAVLLSSLLYVFLSGLTSAYLVVYLQKGRNGFLHEEVWSLFVNKLGAIIVYSLVSGILTVFAFVFLVIPGIFVSVPLSFVVMVTVAEDKGMSGTLSRCFQLVKNNWWKTLGILLVAYLIISTLGFLFSVPAMIIGAVKGFLTASGKGAGDIKTTGVVLATVVGELGKYLIYPIFFVVTGIQYFNLKEQKEMSGLHRKVAAISEQE
jgi:hypothetical protein